MSSSPIPKVEQLVKSKQRVAAHGEVFTPSHIVNSMLNLVRAESARIDSRFLEPACGEGNFLRQVLLRKLASVQSRYGKNEFERRHYALFGLMCIYGIELLEDNAEVCRENLIEIFTAFIDDAQDQTWESAARVVVSMNIVQADALSMKHTDGRHIVFPEWAYLGRGKFKRRDFQYSELTQRSSLAGTLFEASPTEEVFAPSADFSPMTVKEIAESRNE